MAQTTKLKILYIEDDADIANIYKMRLELDGFDVLWLDGSGDVTSAGRAFGPDLVLLDYMLPGKDGGALLKEFRESPEVKNAKIIVLSAIGEKDQINEILAKGADQFLIKSQVTLEGIIGKIKAALGQ